ncbi:adenylate cyclase [Sporothrix brasiliensis 5110]|uniref:Adenylate cyclase n=1 Tax=Sporothrix brasiliensis 5110 TaxID=1398154 RepID=A0A0C2IFB0_9PEZI|nr:adenylate cyclase [Sporothrix brasiliensis 5110]KIH87911.1 adenylate cyclase [Sporothrix brasiliensis 5110]
MAQDGEQPAVAVSEDQTTETTQTAPRHDLPTTPHQPQTHITLPDGTTAAPGVTPAGSDKGDGEDQLADSVTSTAASPGLRNSKGWDGKLRMPKKDASPTPATGTTGIAETTETTGATATGDPSGHHNVALANPEALSDPEYSDDENVVPGEEIAADEDLLNDEDPDTDEILATHARIHDIDALRLERFKKVVRLCLRQNSIQSLSSGLAPVADTLQELDVYDNLVSHMRGVEKLPNLTSLDLSFNKIKHIKHLAPLTKLVDLYLVANKVSSLDGLADLPAAATLRMLELGSNRLRSIAPLAGFGFVALEELWLAKNKITSLEGLRNLPKLRLLSVQSNRIRDLRPLHGVPTLEELYISHNALESLESLRRPAEPSDTEAEAGEAAAANGDTTATADSDASGGAASGGAVPRLRVLDVSNNALTSFSGIEHLAALEEVWASYNRVADFADVERCLRDKKDLDTVYLEGNPLQLRAPALYRNKVRMALPQVQQIDATFIREK